MNYCFLTVVRLINNTHLIDMIILVDAKEDAYALDTMVSYNVYSRKMWSDM